MTSEQKPTAAAMRAAQKIVKEFIAGTFVTEDGRMSADELVLTAKQLAAIIDRETALPQLAEAMEKFKALFHWADSLGVEARFKHHDTQWAEVVDEAETALEAIRMTGVEL